jgi:predicted amidohydrolase YtcJ
MFDKPSQLHACLAAVVVFLVSLATPAAAQIADTIYSGGDILTMRGNAAEYAESLAVKDGTILFVGAATDVKKHVGPATKTVDLASKTLLPGFIDTHGHMVYFGKNLIDANLFGTADIPDLVTRMKKQAERTPADGWIVGFGPTRSRR